MSQLLVCGVDEVGRGPLAGPVIAAAVILDPTNPIAGLRDSKKLSEQKRQALDLEIRHKALCWAMGQAGVAEIDSLNILQASLLAMQRAVAALELSPEHALVDGNRAPELACSCQAIVGGDDQVDCISAASIVAKVARDRLMLELDQQYPGYGLGRHKGYPTQQHLQALQALGVSDIHRRSFKPVKRLLSQ